MGPSPSDFMAAVPHTPNSNSDWGAAYARELKNIAIKAANGAPRSVQVHLGPSELGHECLAGDTEVVTREGIKKIKQLAGSSPELLVPLTYKGSDVRKRWGRFVKSPVTCFGEQELYRVVLRRNQERKEIFATAEHGWYRSYWSGKQKKQQRLTTLELKVGHKLTQLRRSMPHSATLMDVAAAQGFVFGDGTSCGNRADSNRVKADKLTIYDNGKDVVMLRFFPDSAVKDVKNRAVEPDRGCQLSHEIGPLPKFWKNLPPLGESSSFLVSWLAGYFAADGSVSKDDGHCTISSAFRENLEFVRDLAAVCGIGYGQITTEMRVGISGKNPASKATPLYKLSLRRRDLPEWFFLIEEHARRVREANRKPERDPHWRVESVEATGRTESVYCATVEGVRAFGLADDLMTGNCDRQVVAKMAATHKTNNISDPWASIVGTAIHAWLADAFEFDNTQTNVMRWVAEARVTPDPENGENAHPGTADLYDALTHVLTDHKCQSESVRDELRKNGPPRHYFVQMLLYATGYRNLGLPVERVVLASWPRTKSSLDDFYVWEHAITPEDEQLVRDVIEQTKIRQLAAEQVKAGRLSIMQITPSPSRNECHYCPIYRPQAAYDGRFGCPGTLLLNEPEVEG